MREELTGGSAAWPEDYRVVKGWSEGTAVLQETREEADDADRVKAWFFARLESRRACPEGRRKRRLAYLHGDSEVRAGRPGAGDDPDHGVCLGEDEQGAGERGTATRTRVRGRAA